MDYYFAQAPDEADFFGAPSPAPGVRVSFVAELLFAAQERELGRPVQRRLTGDEGLVVEEEPRAILIWPCRLWRVGEVAGVARRQPRTSWFRCEAFTVLEELPSWLVMGSRGDVVAAVLDQARALTAEQVRELAAMDDAGEQRRYAAAWQRWLAGEPRSGLGSPIGLGLSTLHYAVREAARRAGDDVFAWDDENGVQVLADAAWQQAGQAAAAAAMALGAPEIFDGSDAEAARRWIAVMGDPVRGHRGP